jgi:hypothetical protein
MRSLVFRPAAGGLRTVLTEALLKVRQPLGINERLENAPNFELVVLVAQPSQESKVHNLVDVHINPVHQLGLIGAARHEQLYEIDKLIAREYEARVAANRIMLGQFLAH